ncbi:MAG: hypothetical protein JWQ09_4261 [Segetibacter sp.]|nr:hypothetical protein [Segetibacter sp.]
MKSVDISGLAGLMVLVSAFSLAMQNSMYLIVAYAVLLIIIVLTWRLYLPNAFTFVMVFHWVQVISYIFYVNSSWKGDMGLLTKSSASAFFYSLTGLIVMSFVFSQVAYKDLEVSSEVFEDALNKINPKKVLYLYLILYFMSGVLSRSAFAFGGLTQVFINVALLKWAGFVLLGYLSFKNKEYRIFFALAFVLDFVGGLFSFFSSFKDVFFYTAVILMTFISKINFNVSFKGSAVAILLFYIAVVWTVVKGDYRGFLNEGSGRQVVNVSQERAFGKLSDLISAVNEESINEGIGAFFYRLQYVYHFAKSMDMVPANIPYQHGALWRETVEFVTVPRILNPNKGSLDNSVKASKYTGIQFSGASRGVSFSLGYFADCYVDFGIPGMFIALAIIAFIFAKIYRFFLLSATGNIVINYAIVIAFFVQFSFFEMDGTFMFGRLFTSFIVFLLLKYTLFPRMEKFISY